MRRGHFLKKVPPGPPSKTFQKRREDIVSVSSINIKNAKLDI